MKRQEVLLNLTLLVIIAALIFFIYESRQEPRGLDELPVVPASAEVADADDGEGDEAISADAEATSGQDATDEDSADPDEDASEDEPEAESATADDAPPGAETGYAARPRARKPGSTKSDSGNTTGSAKEVADAGDAAGANRGGQFGTKNVFRALLTPTPTPTPPPPTPAPTPDIGKALGAWRLLSVYEGKAMIEDVQKSAAGEEGAIFEIPPGGTKQVDAGGGVMKTVTLTEIDAENPYNPEVTFGMEDTKAQKKINLDTEPAAAPAQPAPKK